MDSDKQIQVFQTNNNLPAVRTAEDLASVRLNEERFPHYGNMPMQVRRAWLTGKVIELNMIKHIRPDEDMLVYDIAALDEYIMDDPIIRDLTQVEISRAFRLGIKGDFGEYYGLTADALFGFLEGFIRTPEKKESARLVRVARGLEKPKSEGALDYLKSVNENREKVWAERMQEWKKEVK